ncbi:MAG: FHA domain-containing protein [Planctomycetota bacterium]|nr:FHA domain-containing protein [Planctomycetota bacterium]
MAKLVVNEDGKSRELLLSGEVTLGRHPENSVVLNDPAVSRKHARIAPLGGVFIIDDLGSAKGTLVNGEKFTRRALRNGDKISIGKVEIDFVEEAPSADDFERTMVGSVDDFERTLIGPLPKIDRVEAPTAPAAPPAAPGSASVAPAPLRQAPVPAQIILPPRRTVSKRTLVLTGAVTILAVALWLLPEMLAPKPVAVNWGEVEELFDKGEFAQLQAQFALLAKEHLDDADVAKLKQWKIKVAAKQEASEIEALIQDSGDLSEAYRRAQAAVNKFEGYSERFLALSDQAFTGTFVLATQKAAEDAKGAMARDRAQELARNLQEAVSKYRAQEAVLGKLTRVAAAYQGCVVELDRVRKLLDQLDRATSAWSDTQAARRMEEVDREVEALVRLAACSADSVAAVAGPVDAADLLRNARAFAEGSRAYARGEYDLATEMLAKVSGADFHAAPASRMLEKIRQEADFRAGLRLYLEGKGTEALETLKNVKTEKAILLRAHVQEVVGAWAKLMDMQTKGAKPALLKEAMALLPSLSKTGDGWYFEKTEALVSGLRRNFFELHYMGMERAYKERKFGEVIKACATLEAEYEGQEFADLRQKLAELRDRVMKTVKEETGRWVQQARVAWEKYRTDPISSNERIASRGIPETFRGKAKFLNEAFTQIAPIKDLVQVLTREEAKPALDLYDPIRSETLLQMEKLFIVRTQYSQLGNFQLVRNVEEMIRLLPDVPGNPYTNMLKDNRE